MEYGSIDYLGYGLSLGLEPGLEVVLRVVVPVGELGSDLGARTTVIRISVLRYYDLR